MYSGHVFLWLFLIRNFIIKAHRLPILLLYEYILISIFLLCIHKDIYICMYAILLWLLIELLLGLQHLGYFVHQCVIIIGQVLTALFYTHDQI